MEECFKLSSKIYAVLSAHRLAVPSLVKISWFCGVGISLMTQKDQSCSDFYLLFLFPNTSSKYQKKKQILKLFPGFKTKTKNCSTFTYILLNLDLGMPWQMSFIFKICALIGLEFWTHVGPSGKFSGTFSNSYSIFPKNAPVLKQIHACKILTIIKFFFTTYNILPDTLIWLLQQL